MTPPDRDKILAGEQAFRRALKAARAVGGPAADIDALVCRATEPPRLINGLKLSRMTLGIQRLLQKRASMPDAMGMDEILTFFVVGPQVGVLFSDYDAEAQEWRSQESREVYAETVGEMTEAADATREVEAISRWIHVELQHYHRLSHGDAEDTSAGSGSEGSRAGWWMRAVEDMIATYGATIPPGMDATAWAVWHFPLNDYLTLQPAALERNGAQLPEHYGTKAARAARRKAKAAFDTPPPPPPGDTAAPPAAET